MPESPLRVAIVSPYALDVPGGVQTHVRRLAAQLASTGDEVLLVGPARGDVDASVPTATVGKPITVAFNGSRAPVCVDPRASGRTNRALAEFRPDVVHVHEPMVPLVGWAAVRSGHRLAVPTIATYHAYSDADRLYRMARMVVRRLDRRLSARIAVSPSAAGYHAGALGHTVASFTVVPNGIDAGRFAYPPQQAATVTDDRGPVATAHGRSAPAASGSTTDGGGSGRASVLFVGRLERRKGARDLIAAVVELRARRDVELVVVGDGPDRSACEMMVPAQHRHAVRFVGRVDNEALAAHYVAADVFVAPSLGGESFGIVLLEAMAAGTAVIASDIPGYRAVLEGGRLGRLVPPGDQRALAEAIEQVIGDPQRRAAVIEAGRAAAANCDWSLVAERLRRLYVAACEAFSSVADGDRSNRDKR